MTPRDSAELASRFWDDRTRAQRRDADLAELGTITDDAFAVRHRDALEKAHLSRILRVGRSARVLDLGGGAGRIALWLAPRVASVTIVDASKELLEIAGERARALGLHNVTTVHASVLDFVPDAPYDAVLAMNVATHLEDDELPRFVDVCARAVATGGQVVMKEPVTTDGTTRDDERRNASGELTYRARFRPRSSYPAVFSRAFDATYQRATCAHPFPFFLRGTDGAVTATRGGLARSAFERARPLLLRADPTLLEIETVMRATPGLARLLAPVPVLQDFYVFEPKRAPEDRAVPALSVVVIAFNEQECIEPVTRELEDALEHARIAFELVLVDDGSQDFTLARMRELEASDRRVRVVALRPNRGIGGALRAGFDAATGEWVSWVPADGQIAPETVVELFRRRHEATMLTTVYRSRADAWYRHAISQTLNVAIRASTGQQAKSGGNYLFARAAWQRLGPRDDDSMMISTAFRKSLREAGEPIVEVQIDARARHAGRSKVLNPRTIVRTVAALAGIAGSRGTPR